MSGIEIPESDPRTIIMSHISEYLNRWKNFPAIFKGSHSTDGVLDLEKLKKASLYYNYFGGSQEIDLSEYKYLDQGLIILTYTTIRESLITRDINGSLTPEEIIEWIKTSFSDVQPRNLVAWFLVSASIMPILLEIFKSRLDSGASPDVLDGWLNSYDTIIDCILELLNQAQVDSYSI